MITETISNAQATYTIGYQVIEENNEVYLILDSLDYCCSQCETRDTVDLSLVPVHNVVLMCIACSNTLCTIPEEQFKIKLIQEVIC